MSMRTVFFALALTVTTPAFAQDAGDDTPDASAGNGGADQMTQEGDEGTNGTCSLNRDCERGFTCVNGTCHYAGYRMATQAGCSAAPGLALGSVVFAAITLLGTRRLRRRR